MKHICDCFGQYMETSSRAELAELIVTAQDISVRFRAILGFYRLAKAEIVDAGEGWGIDPYEVRWTEVFTPIEAAMWHELRRARLVFYPQLPVGGAFVDFGNTFHKIAIECDGFEFHLDKGKDRDRDRRLLTERGWRTYRISGADCMKEQDEDDYEDLRPTPIRRFVLDMSERMREQEKVAA